MHMTKEVKIALTAIVAAVLLFVGINFLKGINLFQSSNRFCVAFDNISGLTVSSPVYANGYAVGIVRDITYDYKKNGKVTVGIELDKDMRLPEESVAELETEMLGGVKMNLIMGANPLKFLNPGDTIRGKMHDGALNKMEAMIPTVEKALPKLDSILTSLNRLLADPALAATLRNAEQMTGELAASSKKLNRLLSNDMPKISGNLCSISENMVSVSKNMADVDIAKTMKHADSTMYNVQQISASFLNKLNSKDNSLGLLLNDRCMYDNLNHTVGSADSLLIDLKAHPKRYVHFSIFGRKDK